MPITLAAHAGFCVGVRKAMEKAFSAAEEAGRNNIPCYALGDLIHNDQAVEKLRSAGVVRVDRVEDVPRGSVIILRSHGVGPDIMEACEKQGLRTVDCTCAYVQALHNVVQETRLDGTPVILVGDGEHPEVTATAGWCKSKCIIIENEAQAESMQPLE